MADAKAFVAAALSRTGDSNIVKLALMILGVSNDYEERALAMWRSRGAPSLAAYAPYAAHVVGVELFFEVAVGAGLIGTADRNNRGDIAYLFYAPFCHVFISSDSLHKRCAPLFLRADQCFAWGPDVKADLNRLMKKFEALPEEEKEKGLGPPAQDRELIDRINRTGDAPVLPPEEVDFDVNDAEFVHITRRVSKRRGSWWVLPKNLKC